MNTATRQIVETLTRSTVALRASIADHSGCDFCRNPDRYFAADVDEDSAYRRLGGLVRKNHAAFDARLRAAHVAEERETLAQVEAYLATLDTSDEEMTPGVTRRAA